MKKNDGRFKKGEHRSPETEFKPGEHWRNSKPYWDRDWLYNEYITKSRSASEIASDFGCKENNILYFLAKFNIPRRAMSETRSIKKWGAIGKDNPMYGKNGSSNPNWRGGVTPERQAFYSSQEWAKAVSKVWKRDKATCQRCGKRSGKRGSFHIHHIAPFSIVALRLEVNNLVLLCRDCHSWVHSKKNTTGDFISKKGG